MKLGMDILCASQVATSISGFSMDHEASSSSSTSTSTIHLGGCGSSGRAIDRHNPIIRDATRLGKVLLTTTTTPVPPCSSYDDQPPINNIPKPHHHHHHHKNSQKNNSSKENTPNHRQSKKIISNDDEKRESTRSDHRINSIIRKSSWSCTKPSGDFVSPPGSSRYLLSSTHHHKSLSSDFDPLEPYSKVSQAAANSINKDEPISSSSSSSKPTENSSSSSPPDQVIVLSVSLHCRGCERKMKKHLSKMEGVTHYDIDFKAKKLTVVGDVTPLAVLASVSKVKNAQLLTLPLASSVCTNISEIQKERGVVL